MIVGGLLLGVLNTVLTESVMEATDLPRSVASSAYSAVRFLGGAIAPPLAAELASDLHAGHPVLLRGAAPCSSPTVILIAGPTRCRTSTAVAEPALVEAEAIGVGEAALTSQMTRRLHGQVDPRR